MHAEIGAAFDHLVHDRKVTAVGEGAADLDLEARLAIVAEPLGRVEAGELELMVPGELEHDPLRRMERRRQRQQQGEQQPTQAASPRPA